MYSYKSDEYRLVDKRYVVCCGCALARCGLTYGNGEYLIVFTNEPELNNFDSGVAKFVYEKSINYEYLLEKSEYNEKILLPEKERAIVESILHIDCADEGELCEAIHTYLNSPVINGSKEALYEVADFFNVDRKQIDYWITESMDYTGA